MAKLLDAPSCLGCVNNNKWGREFKQYRNVITEYDKCSVGREQGETETYISTILAFPHWYNVNPKGDCSRRYVKETIKNSRLWVSLYFKGRERDWIIVEPDRHEIFIEANWFVKKVFGIADRFHKWQDARTVKRFEAKSRTKVLTHIVKELPRL